MKCLQFLIVFCSLILSSILELSFPTDILSPGLSIKDGETLISSSQTFELGFFSPCNSKNRYLGIWYKVSHEAVVWVANRNVPIADKKGVLIINNNGSLVLLNQNNNSIWSSNSSRVPQNPVAQLLDSGNFVLRDSSDTSPENYLWQSFDYPSDTLLTGMKLGWNVKTRFQRYLTPWKSSDDPSPSETSLKLDIDGPPEFVINTGSKIVARSGPWNGEQLGGIPMLRKNVFTPMLVHENDEIYFTFNPLNDKVITRLLMNQSGKSGKLQRLVWNEDRREWSILYSWPFDFCDSYAQCGANSICRTSKSPVCQCLKGFVPKSDDEWNSPDTQKCVKKVPLESDCENGEGFLKLAKMKLPDTKLYNSNQSMNIKECQAECLKNCSCKAYTNLDIRGKGSGCLMWFGDLIDMKECSEEFTWGQDIFVRVPASELVDHSNKKKLIKIVLAVSTVSGMVILGLVFCKFWKVKRNKGKEEVQTLIGLESSRKEDIEVPLFDLATIAAATNNFSKANRIGEGGFGPVYKGNLPEGQEIAVKRLSKDSRQGLEEFKNEVVLIGKLQHRNLVALIGSCIERDEMMLIYEYMPNKSLDLIIFDRKTSKLLSWQKRLDIIIGIARGLLYLHQDSKLQIIHRDLKASNILLDSNLNPKISDFGLARILKYDDKEANTNRVIETYSYMSPEYATEGKFSLKSDVFSLGVILLEIISGRRNRGFRHPDHHHNLIGHAWLLWIEGRALELMDKCLEDSFIESQVQRCIQVGLLCVQKFPENRPEMSSVVFMLANEGGELPQPRQPGFFTERGFSNDSTSGKEKSHTVNALSITRQEGR